MNTTSSSSAKATKLDTSSSQVRLQTRLTRYQAEEVDLGRWVVGGRRGSGGGKEGSLFDRGLRRGGIGMVCSVGLGFGVWCEQVTH